MHVIILILPIKTFSPWVTNGCLTVRRVIQAAVKCQLPSSHVVLFIYVASIGWVQVSKYTFLARCYIAPKWFNEQLH